MKQHWPRLKQRGSNSCHKSFKQREKETQLSKTDQDSNNEDQTTKLKNEKTKEDQEQ